MRVWTVWIFDYFWEMTIPVGVYDTEEKANTAADIVLAQKRKDEPNNVPDGRYEIYIESSELNAFISNSISVMVG